MAFTELLSSSFLFSITIIIILFGLIFSYISYRMSEQDHKITSMLGLITTMAEEMQFFRSKLSRLTGPEQQQQHHHIVLDPNNLVNMVAGNSSNLDLISVSDGDCNEEFEEDSSEGEEDYEDEDDVSEGDSSDGDSSEGEDLEEEDLQEDIKVLNISSIGNDEIELVHHDDLNIKSIHLEEPIDITQHHIYEPKGLSDNISSDLKTISIVDLEETNKKPTDYKKMSLNKLREVVIERGIVPDASKLKKNELLKLLGVESV
jgi:hypothetical protein